MEDTNALAEALVQDAPGETGEAHWNEEAKALLSGLILQIAAAEPSERRNLATLGNTSPSRQTPSPTS